MRLPRRSLTLVALCLACLTRVLPAQTTGEIRGTVLDANGSGLPGASVEASSSALQGTRASVTGAGGSFQIPALPPGMYRVVVAMPGFAKVERQVQVRLDRTASVAA